MGIHTEILNVDLLYSATPGAKIINDINPLTRKDNSDFNNLLYNRVEEGSINEPSCGCGKHRGRFRLGKECPECGTPVEDPIDGDIKPKLFIRRPNGSQKLFQPWIWLILRHTFKIGHRIEDSFDLIQYLTNPYYDSPYKDAKILELINTLKDNGLLVRNYNYFVENFWMYMEFLFNLPRYKPKSKGPDNVYLFLQENHDKLTAEYLPLVNKCVNVVEETSVGRYIDKSIVKLADAARLMTGIDVDTITIKENSLMSKVSRCLTLLSDYYFETFKTSFDVKKSLFRRHVYGTRMDYSFRTVVTSIPGEHFYNELHIPWTVACNVFKKHIENILFKQYKLTPNQIQDFLYKNSHRYHPVLDEIFKFLINSAKEINGFGFPTFSNRNPSLTRSSILTCYITKVKTDPEDVTTSESPITTVYQNGDYDGDEKSHALILDILLEEQAHLLSPEMNVLNLGSIRGFHGAMNLTKPVAYNLSRHLIEPDEAPTPEQNAFVDMFLVD